MSTFTDPDQANATKAAVHGSLFTLAALCGVYNAASFLKRGERHLAVNALVYGALMVFEVVNVRHHCGAGPERPEAPSS